MPRALSAHEIDLRPVVTADLAFLRGLYAACRADEMARVGWPAEAVRRFLDDQFRLQQQHFAQHHPHVDDWLVTRSGAPIGRLLVDRTMRPWRLLEIALAAEEQGQGRGSALLKWLQQAAGAQDAGGIDLHVAYDNPRAAALYRRIGFVEVSCAAAATHRRLLWDVS